MLDFVMNLLIFFIITTSFVKEAGIQVDRGLAVTAVHKDSGNILIAIRQNGEVWMDRKQVDLREVRPIVERFHIERPEDTVVVIADKAAPAGLLAQVMDQVKAAGIKDVAIGAPEPGGRLRASARRRPCTSIAKCFEVALEALPDHGLVLARLVELLRLLLRVELEHHRLAARRIALDPIGGRIESRSAGTRCRSSSPVRRPSRTRRRASGSSTS